MSRNQPRVALDARMANMTGIGRYIRTLVAGFESMPDELRPDLSVLAGPEVSLTAAKPVALRSGPFSALAHVEVPRALAAAGIDLLHSPHFDVPLLWTGRQVTTIHDCAPQVVPGELASTRGMLYYRLMMLFALSRSHAVITVSEFTKKEVCRLYRVTPRKIHVIHTGLHTGGSERRSEEPGDWEALAGYGIRDNFGLYVGLPRPRKNLRRLVAALGKALAELGPAAQFVFAGKADVRFMDLKKEAHDCGIGEQVVVTGEVPQSVLRTLYARARLFAFPSLYEGFGLPVLEAMAAGAPVLTSNVSSLPEVAGDAALLVDPFDTQAIADGLLRLWLDDSLRRDLRERGYRRAREFPVGEFAQRTAAVYRLVANA